jgi:hypothetical protein
MKSHTYSPLNHRPARPGITSQRTQITGYLAGAVGTAALLGAPQAEAAVVAVTFGFGSELSNPPDVFNISNTVGPGFGNLFSNANPTVVQLGARTSYGWGSVYSEGTQNGYQGLPTFFASGTTIGNNSNGVLGSAFFQLGGGPLDFTSDQLNKNIAFKTSTNNWGWANVSWTEANNTLTINSAFVETTANTPITITAVPEPSRALLALAGLGGVALRRRRKQAA